MATEKRYIVTPDQVKQFKKSAIFYTDRVREAFAKGQAELVRLVDLKERRMAELATRFIDNHASPLGLFFTAYDTADVKLADTKREEFIQGLINKDFDAEIFRQVITQEGVTRLMIAQAADSFAEEVVKDTELHGLDEKIAELTNHVGPVEFARQKLSLEELNAAVDAAIAESKTFRMPDFYFPNREPQEEPFGSEIPMNDLFSDWPKELTEDDKILVRSLNSKQDTLFGLYRNGAFASRSFLKLEDRLPHVDTFPAQTEEEKERIGRGTEENKIFLREQIEEYEVLQQNVVAAFYALHEQGIDDAERGARQTTYDTALENLRTAASRLPNAARDYHTYRYKNILTQFVELRKLQDELEKIPPVEVLTSRLEEKTAELEEFELSIDMEGAVSQEDVDTEEVKNTHELQKQIDNLKKRLLKAKSHRSRILLFEKGIRALVDDEVNFSTLREASEGQAGILSTKIEDREDAQQELDKFNVILKDFAQRHALHQQEEHRPLAEIEEELARYQRDFSFDPTLAKPKLKELRTERRARVAWDRNERALIAEENSLLEHRERRDKLPGIISALNEEIVHIAGLVRALEEANAIIFEGNNAIDDLFQKDYLRADAQNVFFPYADGRFEKINDGYSYVHSHPLASEVPLHASESYLGPHFEDYSDQPQQQLLQLALDEVTLAERALEKAHEKVAAARDAYEREKNSHVSSAIRYPKTLQWLAENTGKNYLYQRAFSIQTAQAFFGYLTNKSRDLAGVLRQQKQGGLAALEQAETILDPPEPETPKKEE